MNNNPNIKSSKPIMLITLMVLMLSITIVFAFVGCNSRNKVEEKPENNIEEDLPDPPSDKEDAPKEDEKEEDKVENKTDDKSETQPATAPTVSTPSVTPPITNTVKPKPTPSAPAKSKPNTASYDSITITKNGRYSETKTYNNITIKADDVRLLNKTIKGNLIIDKSVDADEGAITLENVTVDGEILVKGGYSIRLNDVDADTIKIRKDTGRTRLTALGKTEIKNVYTRRSITLREDDLSRNYDGFENLTIENSSNIYVNVDLYNCNLDGIYANDRTKVKAPDKSVEIGEVKAYDAVSLGSRVYAKTFTAYEGGCTYVVEPGRTYGKNGANEPERERTPSKKNGKSSKEKDKPYVLPSPDVKAVYDSSTSLITISWNNVSNAVSYDVQCSTDGTNYYSLSVPVAKSASTVPENSVSVAKDVFDKPPYNGFNFTNFRTKVIASDASGNKSNTSKVTAPTTPPTPPVIPPTVTQLNQPTVVSVNYANNKATISWQPVANASGYLVEYQYDADAVVQKHVDLPTTSLEVSGLNLVGTINFTVTALGNDTTYTNSIKSAVATLTISSVDTPNQPTIQISGEGKATLINPNSASSIAYQMQYSFDNASFSNYSDSTPFNVSDGQTVYAKVIATSADGTKLPATSSVASMAVTKMTKPTITLAGNSLEFTYASGYECVLTVDGTVQTAPTSSPVDLSSHLGKKISFTSTAKEANKINSDTEKWGNTQLETPNGTSANYDNSSKKLSVVFSSALSTDRDYEFIITKNEEPSSTKTVAATISGTSLEATLIDGNALSDASYTVKIIAKAKDVSKYNSNESSGLSFTVTTPIP